MLKTLELCPKKFYFHYVKNISMPVNNDIFEFGKNIHALASYYLQKENIDKMEQSLSRQESEAWNYLKSNKYFSYEVIAAEYNLSFKADKYFFGGRLDALVKNNDEYYILDYKTGAIPKNPKIDFQTIIYILAVKEFYKTDNIHFVYIDLKNKSEIQLDYSDELYDSYITRLLNTVKKLDIAEIYQRKSDCRCEYSIICY